MTADKTSQKVREIFVVARHADGWAVSHDGEFTHISRNKDEVSASARRLARASHEAGRPAQVTVEGERGFFAPRAAAALTPAT
ncbi:hypothetical protein CSW58_13200 [Caulobacter sp. B11]|jgi:hypothetical protein|uniref:DUF2188 domain-containing protein n=1 Tax=Caulobacter sp. B11 TaxID=2048899 RepID=UPI000C129BAA|nr:DUF2188 domain-containing protein [Caulobacter sp. B11]PHY12357.1 hypothetical protein CSW58_13200 [Caulobacter sp. B11]